MAIKDVKQAYGRDFYASTLNNLGGGVWAPPPVGTIWMELF